MKTPICDWLEASIIAGSASTTDRDTTKVAIPSKDDLGTRMLELAGLVAIPSPATPYPTRVSALTSESIESMNLTRQSM